MNRERRIGIGLIIIGAGLALNSLLGPLLTRVMVYPVTRTMLNQTLGLDAFSLLVAAPASIIIGIRALRSRPDARVLALGPASYAAYMLAQYVIGPDYLHFPVALLLQLLLFVLGWSVVAAAWSRIPPEQLEPTRRRDRVLASVLLLLTGFVLLRYLPALLGSLTRAPLPAEARGDPAMFWTILLLDVGIVVPLAAASGIELITGGSHWARKAGYALVGWFAMVGPAVAAMVLVMDLRNDRFASTEMTVGFLLLAFAAVAAAAWLYRPLFHPGWKRESEPAG